METHYDKILDSPSKNSYIGSYYQPPDRILPIPRQLELTAHPSISTDPVITSPQVSQTRPNIDSRAVVDALKNLQQKIRRLELERKQAEQRYSQYSNDAQNHQPVSSQSAASQPEAGASRKELDSKLQSAEARCGVLEKQLDFMRKMIENAEKARNTVTEHQVLLQDQQSSSSNSHFQREKLEKLESECMKLSRTQALAENKLTILEQKLLEEEHERQLVQEKAEQLQRELDINLRLSAPTSVEKNAKKKTTKMIQKSCRLNELPSPVCRKMPFVAGTSTSPSHSVHANIQSILHMMKHHQPQLCERVSALQRSQCGVRKSLQKDFSQSSHRPEQEIKHSDQSLGSLSDLLLALQDELGQMSFEHQDLVGQIAEAQHQEQKQDLWRELERLVARMEEKGAQISKLRKHQQTVQKLTQSQPCSDKDDEAKVSCGMNPLVPTPVKSRHQKGKKVRTVQNNLLLLRETQRFRKSLKQDDLSWET